MSKDQSETDAKWLMLTQLNSVCAVCWEGVLLLFKMVTW